MPRRIAGASRRESGPSQNPDMLLGQMSERPRASRSSSERELSSEDLRRQLEGRLEIIEAARKRYATLEKQLKGITWKRRLRAQTAFLQEVIDQEAPLDETLIRARRRGEVEGWPESLPALEPLRALKALTGEPPPEGLNLEVSWILEELRWLTEAEFDVHLARVVEATGGLHWSAWESRRKPGTPVWKEIHITQGSQSLLGKVDWSQQAAAERIFESWPSPES
jgi:hypothetical protein